jgi:hypothetical protein
VTTVMVPADGSASGVAWRDLMRDLVPPTEFDREANDAGCRTRRFR